MAAPFFVGCDDTSSKNHKKKIIETQLRMWGEWELANRDKNNPLGFPRVCVISVDWAPPSGERGGADTPEYVLSIQEKIHKLRPSFRVMVGVIYSRCRKEDGYKNDDQRECTARMLHSHIGRTLWFEWKKALWEDLFVFFSG